jgi:hypothetical protein
MPLFLQLIIIIIIIIKMRYNENRQMGSIKLQRRSSLNLLGEAGTDFQISK